MKIRKDAILTMILGSAALAYSAYAFLTDTRFLRISSAVGGLAALITGAVMYARDLKSRNRS